MRAVHRAWALVILTKHDCGGNISIFTLSAGNFSRWGYNQETEECEEFNYGGCKGNLNSFITQTECENSCKDGGGSRAMCLLPRAPGPCQDKIPKWYFDNFEKRCQPFYYGGCEGNGEIIAVI